MKKKTWKIIVRHLVLALLAIIWLIPIVWLVVTSLSTTKGVSYQHFFPGTLDTGKLSSTVLQDRYSSELSGMV